MLPPETGRSQHANWPDWIKPRRLFELGQNILNLERTVTDTCQEVSFLQDQVKELQHQVHALSVQNEMLSKFLQATISGEVSARYTGKAMKEISEGEK